MNDPERQRQSWEKSHGSLDAVAARGHGPLHVGAAVVAVLAAPIAAWWLIGDLSEPARGTRDLDYVVRAPQVAPWAITTAGAVAVGAMAVAIVILAHAVRTGRLQRGWLGVVALLMVEGALIAGIARMLTAGSVGANIGGGLALIFGVPVVACLAICALAAVNHMRDAPTDRS